MIANLKSPGSSGPLASAALMLLLGSFLLGGCTSLVRDPDADQIADLKRQLNEEKRNATVGDIEVARLRDELSQAKAALRRAEEELARRRSDDTLRAEGPIRPPQPKVDQAELEEEPTLAEEMQAVPPPAAVAGGEDPQVLYDRGYTLFHQKSYDLAEASFRTFLTRHPESDLADNASFWIGESYFARGDYASALTEFADTVDRFPQGNKVADALFKAGRCLEEMGRLDEAADTYREVQQRFPSSVAAAGAKERLDALRPGRGQS